MVSPPRFYLTHCCCSVAQLTSASARCKITPEILRQNRVGRPLADAGGRNGVRATMRSFVVESVQVRSNLQFGLRMRQLEQLSELRPRDRPPISREIQK